MKLKTIILASLLGLFLTPLSAQKKFNIGLQAGYSYNLPKLNSDTTQNSPGFHAGPVFSYRFSEMFGVESGVLMDYFNSTVDKIKVLNSWTRIHTTSMYLNVPLRFTYTAQPADDLLACAMIGPNFNYGLNKRSDTETFVDGKITKTDRTKTGVNIYDYPAVNQRFDLQFGIGISIQYFNVALRASYDFGLLDRLKTDKTLKANDFKIGIGYIF